MNEKSFFGEKRAVLPSRFLVEKIRLCISNPLQFGEQEASLGPKLNVNVNQLKSAYPSGGSAASLHSRGRTSSSSPPRALPSSMTRREVKEKGNLPSPKMAAGALRDNACAG